MATAHVRPIVVEVPTVIPSNIRKKIQFHPTVMSSVMTAHKDNGIKNAVPIAVPKRSGRDCKVRRPSSHPARTAADMMATTLRRAGMETPLKP
ncbi:MAG TPA: hypothetical protein VGR57_01475, partial [Ktedonobacterales bacterium]|nr:hypothetical protein [Ktedonobacterales bacterium]